MKDRRWQDVAMLILGLWLIASPFVLQYPDMLGIAVLNSYVFGFGVMLFAAIALFKPQMWEVWVNLVLGVWLMAAPVVLGFRTETDATANHLLIGLLIVIDALSVMVPRYTRKAT